MINILVCNNNSYDDIYETKEINNEIETKKETVIEYKPYTNMCFVGDIFFSRKVKEAYDTYSIDGIIDKNYYKILSESDLNVGNLECAITDDIEDEADKKYLLQTPVKYAHVIKDVGFDLLTLANNHILDYGEKGMTNTMEVLKKNNISYVGVGNNIEEARAPFIKELNGKKYAILSASSVLPKDSWKAAEDRAGVNNGYNIAAVCEDIVNIKDEVDKVIVYMHWGTELATMSEAREQIFAHKLVDFGADLVVGSHPHVLQEIEYYKGVPIVYSLGNFIYGATKKETMLITVCFDYTDNPDGELKLRVYPGLSNYEQVKLYWKEEDMALKCKALDNICDTCYITPDGFVTDTLATSSEIN